MSSIDPMNERCVLIANGDPAVLTSIELLLGREGLGRAVPIDLGEEAIELMSIYGGRVYVVVIDLGLPDMSGFDVLRRVASRLEEPVSVIALTGMRTQIVKSRFEALMRRTEMFCATDFIVTPYQPERLLNSVRNGMEKVHFRRKYWLDRM